MCRTIAEFLLDDLAHKCKLDEIIDATLDRMPTATPDPGENEADMTIEDAGRSIAEKLNCDVVYTGPLLGPDGVFLAYLYTDEWGEGYTFAGRNLMEAKAKFIVKRMQTGGQIPSYPDILDPLGIVEAAERDIERMIKSA